MRHNTKIALNKVYLFILFFITSCGNEKPKEIFTVPNNLDNFVVIYQAKKNFDYNNNIEYKIPKNGILYVDFQRKTGSLNQQVRFENGTNVSDFAIEKFRNNIKENEIYILDMIDGKVAQINRNVTDNDSVAVTTENGNSKKWIGIILGKPKSNQNELRGKLFKKIDSIFKKKK